MEYRRGNNTVYTCQYHVVFCPKYRRSVLIGDVERRFREVAQESIADLDGVAILEMEVMPDHVHLLVEAPPHVAIHKVVRKIKGVTSRVLRQEFQSLRTRIPTLWTNSYFVSTVGGAPLEVVKRYIENQKTSQNQKGKMG